MHVVEVAAVTPAHCIRRDATLSDKDANAGLFISWMTRFFATVAAKMDDSSEILQFSMIKLYSARASIRVQHVTLRCTAGLF